MKQYLSPDQTAKLIELGFEKPKSISGYCQRGPYEYDAETNTKMVVYDDTQYPIFAYSIGELLDMLPMNINNDGRFEEIIIHPNYNRWVVKYSGIFREPTYQICGKELINALYDMILRLKEEGVI